MTIVLMTKDEKIAQGQLIKAAYLRAGLNRAEFSRQVGHHYTTVIKWEQGAFSPKEKVMDLIAEVTGITVAALDPSGNGQAQGDEPIPAYPALTGFLGTVEGRSATPEEVNSLRSYRASHGNPSELTYHFLLQAIRAEDDNPQESADINSEVADEMRRRDIRKIKR